MPDPSPSNAESLKLQLLTVGTGSRKRLNDNELTHFLIERSVTATASQAYRHLKYCARLQMNNFLSANNVLHTLLSPISTASQHYNLRRRTHTYSLPGHDSYLCDCNFITRMLYKDSY